MLYQVFCLVVTNENETILMNLLGGYFSTNNSNLSKKIELTFYWLDIYWLSSSSKYTDCNCNDWISELKLFTLSVYSPCKAVKILRDSKIPLYLLVYPEIAMCLAYAIKSLNFGGLNWGGTPIVVPSKICQILPCLHVYLFLNILSVQRVVQVWILAALFEGDPYFDIPKFCQILFFLHIWLP